MEDKNGFGAGASIVTGLILFGIALSVAASVLPTAINDLETADTTNFSAGTSSLWDLSPLIAVAGFIMLILAIAGLRGNGGREG